jgi:hypothetical protein
MASWSSTVIRAAAALTILRADDHALASRDSLRVRARARFTDVRQSFAQQLAAVLELRDGDALFAGVGLARGCRAALLLARRRRGSKSPRCRGTRQCQSRRNWCGGWVACAGLAWVSLRIIGTIRPSCDSLVVAALTVRRRSDQGRLCGMHSASEGHAAVGPCLSRPRERRPVLVACSPHKCQRHPAAVRRWSADREVIAASIRH